MWTRSTSSWRKCESLRVVATRDCCAWCGFADGCVIWAGNTRGYNIGVRLIDEFLAKSGITNCSDFRETGEVISKVAFKMFLGITADVTS